MAALAIEEIPLGQLKPYERNARTHSPGQVRQIADAVTAFGWTNPILVDEGDLIIAGHGRLLAARSLGMATAPCIRIVGLTDEQRRALTIADNKLGLNAGWDEALLVAELQSLGDLQGLVGFSEDELARLFKGHAGLTDPDEAPEAPAEPVSRTGDLWRLGEHRLLCGDATSADDVARVLGNVQPHLMVTDPPYGVQFDPTWRKGSEKRTYMGGDPDMESVWQEAWKHFRGDVVYIWHAHAKTKNLWIALEELGFEIRQPLIWNKMRFIIGRGNYCFNHEACFYGVREKGDAHWQGARDQPTVWDIPHRASDTNHGAQKPIECMRRPIENSSTVGDAVYEPFSGSGTTMIAAEMMGRSCLALELAPEYVDVAVLRWQAFTGKQATDEAGRPFDAIAEERGPESPRKAASARSRPAAIQQPEKQSARPRAS